ncbi:hypothetical protein Tco_0025789 [Tanacetum coccineum]
MVHQKAILDLALQFDNACTTKEDIRKAYEKCNHIPQESRALIDTFLKESSDKDYELNLSMYRKAAKLEKQMNAKLAWIHKKYNHHSETHIGGSSSQTHEIGDVYLIAEELHQLHLDEEALRETLEEQTMDEKAREEKIRQKQADDDDFLLWNLGLDIDDSDLHLTPVLRSSSSAHVEPSPYTPNPVTIIPGPAGVVQLSNSICVEPSSSTPNPVRIIPGPASLFSEQAAKEIFEDILDLALQFDNACTTKEDLRKAYEKCNHIPQESRVLIDTFLKEGPDKDYELNLSMYRKAAKLEKQMNAKLAWIHEKYNHRSENHIGGSSSQTHEIGDVYLTAEELHQLHLDEKALKETPKEQTMDEKAREEKIRQKQADDDESFMEFGEYSLDIDDSDLHLTHVLRLSSSAHVEPSPYTPNPVTKIPGPAGVVQLSNSICVEPSSSTPNPVRIILGPAGLVQRAKLFKENVFILDPDGALMSTQEYMQKVVEGVSEDADFNSGA